MFLHCDSFKYLNTGIYSPESAFLWALKWDLSVTGSGNQSASTSQGRDGGGCIPRNSAGMWNTARKTLPSVQGLTSALFASWSALFVADTATSFDGILLMVAEPFSSNSSNLTGKTGVMVSYQASTKTFRLERIANGTRTVLATGPASAVVDGQWYRLEVKLDIAANSMILRLNGADHIVSTVSLAAVTGINQVAFGNRHNRVDDALIYNSVPGDNFHDFLGDVLIDWAKPNAAGTFTEFTRSSGTAANYTYVAEIDTGFSSYVSASQAGKKETYGVVDLTAAPTTIHGVVTTTLVRAVNGTTSPSVSQVARVGAEETVSPPRFVVMTALPASLQTAFSEKPGGGAWSLADFNAAEFGFTVATNA